MDAQVLCVVLEGIAFCLTRELLSVCSRQRGWYIATSAIRCGVVTCTNQQSHGVTVVRFWLYTVLLKQFLSLDVISVCICMCAHVCVCICVCVCACV